MASQPISEWSKLCSQFHLQFKELREEITRPPIDREMKALDEAARGAVHSVFQRMKTQLAAIPAAFAPSVPDSQADVSTLFEGVSWVKLHPGQGRGYYKGHAPQLVAQIEKIQGLFYDLRDLHRQIMPLKRVLSLEEQSSVLSAIEGAATPAAIEALKSQNQKKEAAWRQAFESLGKIGQEVAGVEETIRFEIARLNASEHTKLSLCSDLKEIWIVMDSSVPNSLPRNYLYQLGGSKSLQRLRSVINKAREVSRQIDQLTDDLRVAEDKLASLESIHSNLAFIEKKE